MPLARVVSFDGVSAERMAEMQSRTQESDRPDDVPAREIIVLSTTRKTRSQWSFCSSRTRTTTRGATKH